MHWLLWLAFGTICALLPLRTRYMLSVTVGESMLPTLRSGDLLIVNRKAYRHSPPERGDIIVARYHGNFIVKRVVALPGESVEVRKGQVYVNNIPLAEQGEVIGDALDISPGKVWPGKFAVIGDNRSVSLHAVLSKDQIVGRVDYRLPFN